MQGERCGNDPWKKNKKKSFRRSEALFNLVPVGGLEPPRLSATDFESVVSTNSTTLA